MKYIAKGNNIAIGSQSLVELIMTLSKLDEGNYTLYIKKPVRRNLLSIIIEATLTVLLAIFFVAFFFAVFLL